MLRPRRNLIAALAATALLAPAGAAHAASCPGADLQPAAGNLPQVAQATLCLINDQRSQAGIAPVRENALLTHASSDYSLLMVREGFFAHESPEGSTFVERLTDVGYLPGDGAWQAGENLAWGTSSYATPASIVAAWMKSPGHRENILNGGFEEIGLGIALGDPGTTTMSGGATYTTDFGTRAAPVVTAAAATPVSAPRAHRKRATRKHRRGHRRHRGRAARHHRHSR